ncbi:hypothetical protein MMC14_010692 [Varicellaria rhodocarpa]|nr:hypothetical protein [Varicellaria rhodocarpa]
MQLKVLYLMLFAGLALGSPVQQLSKRVPEVDYSNGQFSVAPSSQPFVALDGGITFFFQYDGNFVVYQGSSPIASNAL